jgi:hypothetical protein
MSKKKSARRLAEGTDHGHHHGHPGPHGHRILLLYLLLVRLRGRPGLVVLDHKTFSLSGRSIPSLVRANRKPVCLILCLGAKAKCAETPAAVDSLTSSGRDENSQFF